MSSSTVSKHKWADWHVPKNFKIMFIISSILLIVCVLASLSLGARVISFHEVIDGLFSRNDSYGANVVRKRLSRTIFSLLCGGALGVAGALMQAVTRNPLADPSILGVNTGAALFVICGIAFFNISTANQYIWFALIGAAFTATLVFGVGSMGKGGATPIKLVLAGAATSAALSSLTMAIQIPNAYAMDQFRFWQLGSVGSATWNSIATFLPFLVIGILVAFLQHQLLTHLH